MLVLASSVALLTKRRGGHPMKLSFFVPPMELLNFEHKKIDSLKDALQTAEIAKRNIGYSVTINLEAAAPSNKLQTAPLLIKPTKNDGNFSFSPLGTHNSTMLPAAFVLQLNKVMPVNSTILAEIKKVTNLNIFGENATPVLRTTVKLENPTVTTPAEAPREEQTSLVSLIISHESQGVHKDGQKGLFVSLADQSHCYFITDNPDMTGTVIKSIQFTEPAHVTRIIKLLRQQAIFNALLASCVRQNSKQDLETCYMFEVNVVSLHCIQIFVEHPLKETIVTVEMDLTDVTQVTCKIYGADQQVDAKLENYILRVLQKTVSIPMVLRGLFKYWENEAQEIQRMQKRLFNNGIFTDPKSDDGASKGGEEKDKDSSDGASGSNEDVYSGNGHDSSNAFDICGINKNEIFFKSSDQKIEKRARIESEADLFERNKMSRMMNFDMDDENGMMMTDAAEDLLNENSSSNSSSRSDLPGFGAKKNLPFMQKVGTPPMQKPLDVFEFNDPSPPPNSTVSLPLQSPLAEERAKRIPTPKASPSGLEKRKDIEIIPLKVPLSSPSPNSSSSQSSSSMGITITPINANFANFYKAGIGSEPRKPSTMDEKVKSEKKKKRKRDDNEMGSPAMAKKKSSDSLGSSPSKKSSVSGSPSNQLMGKPSASFKMKSPSGEKSKKSPSMDMMGKPNFPIDGIDDLSFLNFPASDQQQQQVRSQFI